MWITSHMGNTTLLVNNMFGGTIPQGKTLLVACDAKYYVEHFVPLAYSAVGAGEQIHAHVVNPDRGCHGISMVLEEDIGVTYSFERTDLSGIDSRTYYACARFMILPELMAHGLSEALVLDADCLVMNEIDWSQFRDADVGLFFREPLANTGEWETQGSKIAAGAVYVNKGAREFTQDVRQNIAKGPFQWFIDQRALNEAHDKHKDKLEFYGIPSNFMDWEFVEGSTIWTGKGDRKHKNMTYVQAKEAWGSYFHGARDRIWQTKY